MKYRTDFVTNSSSESFYIVTAKYENGTIEEILEDNAPRTQLYDVQQEEDGLYLNGSKIKTKEELCAALLFDNYWIEGIDNIPVEILAALFTFIIGKNNPIELAAQIKRFSELECQYSDDGEKLKDKYDFSILDEPEFQNSTDKDEIISQILGIFDCTYEDIDEDRLEDVLNLYNQNIPFEKTAVIELINHSYDYGEFLGEGYFYVLGDVLGDTPEDFHQISEDDPLFEKEYKRWSDYIDEQCAFHQTDIEDIYLDEALVSGNYDELIGSSTNQKYVHTRLYPNGIAGSLETISSNGEIPDYQFIREWYYTSSGVILNIPSGIKRIGRNAFRDSRVQEVVLPSGLLEIGSFAFDVERNECKISGISDSIEKIGATMKYDLLEYAVKNKKLYAEERDLFCLLECELHQYGPDSYSNHYFSKDPDPKSLRLLAENGCLSKSFSKYPITDLLEKAMKLNAPEFLDILLGTGLELDYADVAHYIYNDTLETLYPLFDKGLKIEASAYDDLIKYSAEHGKPEYTAWLLNRKNEAS